jgi:hypothetical protein
MKALIDQLHEEGFSSTQIKESLFVIEDWLSGHYPILARVYQTELLKKALPELEGSSAAKLVRLESRSSAGLKAG